MADITFSSVTNATTIDNGTGYFDVLMKAISLHIEDQYVKGRLKGTDYATVYLGAMQSAMVQSVQFALQEKTAEAQIDATIAETGIKQAQSAKDLSVKDAQIGDLVAASALKTAQGANETDKLLTAAIQRDVLAAQEELYIRQKQGFDDNKKLKLFEAQLDVYGMAWSSVGGFGTSEASDLPTAFSNAEITALYNTLKV